MKKTCIYFIITFTALICHSQTISLLQNKNILTNKQNIYIDSIDANFGFMKAEIGVRNNSDFDIAVNVKRNCMNVLENSSNMFCWGATCYSPSTSESKNAVIIPGKTTNNTFYVEYIPASSSGESIVEFTFFEVGNVLNNSSIILHFVEMYNTGLHELTTKEKFRIHTTDRKESLIVTCYLITESTLILYNLSGQKVGEFSLPTGNTNINLPFKVKSGSYIFSVLKSNKVVFKGKILKY